MKQKAVRFTSLSVALKELEPFIRNGAHLRTGKIFKRFEGLRSRELLANWIICVVFNSQINKERFTFTSDPDGGDGIIYDSETGDTWLTEHVFIPPTTTNNSLSIEQLILRAIDLKRNKGGIAYAGGKSLIVFLDSGGGIWFPNRVAKNLPEPLLFEIAWVVGLHSVDDGNYVYFATCLDRESRDAPSYKILIDKDFAHWQVEVVQ
jgi:hypothetical protein